MDSAVGIGDLGLHLTSPSPSRKGMMIILNTNNSATKRSLSLSTSLCCMQFSTTHLRLTTPRGGCSFCFHVMQNLHEARNSGLCALELRSLGSSPPPISSMTGKVKCSVPQFPL